MPLSVIVKGYREALGVELAAQQLVVSSVMAIAQLFIAAYLRGVLNTG